MDADEARQIFLDIVEKALRLSVRERRFNKGWINQAKEELKRKPAPTPIS